MPEALKQALPTTTIPVVLVDFEHLMGYLDDVVEACEPPDNPHGWKGWYRSSLLTDAAAIDTIWRKLRRLGKTLVGRGTAPRTAVAAALSYIRHRKARMRYASHRAACLPIGSGATESTCWQMQQRVKPPGPLVGSRTARCPRGVRARTLGALGHRLAALHRQAPPRGSPACMIRVASASVGCHHQVVSRDSKFGKSRTLQQRTEWSTGKCGWVELSRNSVLRFEVVAGLHRSEWPRSEDVIGPPRPPGTGETHDEATRLLFCVRPGEVYKTDPSPVTW